MVFMVLIRGVIFYPHPPLRLRSIQAWPPFLGKGLVGKVVVERGGHSFTLLALRELLASGCLQEEVAS